MWRPVRIVKWRPRTSSAHLCRSGWRSRAVLCGTADTSRRSRPSRPSLSAGSLSRASPLGLWTERHHDRALILPDWPVLLEETVWDGDTVVRLTWAHIPLSSAQTVNTAAHGRYHDDRQTSCRTRLRQNSLMSIRMCCPNVLKSSTGKIPNFHQYYLPKHNIRGTVKESSSPLLRTTQFLCNKLGK